MLASRRDHRRPADRARKRASRARDRLHARRQLVARILPWSQPLGRRRPAMLGARRALWHDPSRAVARGRAPLAAMVRRGPAAKSCRPAPAALRHAVGAAAGARMGQARQLHDAPPGTLLHAPVAAMVGHPLARFRPPVAEPRSYRRRPARCHRRGEPALEAGRRRARGQRARVAGGRAALLRPRLSATALPRRAARPGRRDESVDLARVGKGQRRAAKNWRNSSAAWASPIPE